VRDLTVHPHYQDANTVAKEQNKTGKYRNKSELNRFCNTEIKEK
jgi:hypothetical protein